MRHTRRVSRHIGPPPVAQKALCSGVECIRVLCGYLGPVPYSDLAGPIRIRRGANAMPRSGHGAPPGCFMSHLGSGSCTMSVEKRGFPSFFKLGKEGKRDACDADAAWRYMETINWVSGSRYMLQKSEVYCRKPEVYRRYNKSIGYTKVSGRPVVYFWAHVLSVFSSDPCLW